MWGVAKTYSVWSSPSILWFDLCIDCFVPNKIVTRHIKLSCALSCSHVCKRHVPVKGLISQRCP
jgi:hypothetical protein